MSPSITPTTSFDHVFPACRRILGPRLWHQLTSACAGDLTPDSLTEHIRNACHELPYLGDLAQLELDMHALQDRPVPVANDARQVNPHLRLVPTRWKDLYRLIEPWDSLPAVSSGDELLLLWQHPRNARLMLRPASDEDLLVLKIVLENLSSQEVAAAGGLPIGAVDEALDRAVNRGILLQPPSRIRRDQPPIAKDDSHYLAAGIFTLQWHLTQKCDLNCRHCYDRSPRAELSLAQSLAVLDNLRAFCRGRFVKGQVSFTGGNPLLSPHFYTLYRAAADRGLAVAVLGNPTTDDHIRRMLAIQAPAYYQVSLEGLEAHNDYIRQQGHFRRTLDFLDLLRELGVYSMVMLTLTRDNIDQVLPLAELLNGRTDLFTFNRLALVGRGARLALPTPDSYAAFLREYLDAARHNPVMALKDNLLNITRRHKGQSPFGGCTGFGCGAAFNFLALLPDGEVHACRKFPSPLGSILKSELSDIYDSPLARRYRQGPDECRGCDLNLTCRGCLALSHSFGLDVFQARDPFCFI